MIFRLERLSNMGTLVLMFMVMMIFGGIAVIYISSIALTASQQNEDLKDFFFRFNQSVVENRERVAEENRMHEAEEQREQAFENASLLEIARDQNQTQELLPPLIQSFNDTAMIRAMLPDLINNTENVTDLVVFLSQNFGAESDYIDRENFQYNQSNSTATNVTRVLQTVEEIKALLNGEPDNEEE